MSDCGYTYDPGYESGIESLINDIHKLQVENGVLAQRYQQLEQVVRKMYAALHINEHCSIEFIRDEGDCGMFRTMLEELGVSVDG